MSYNSPFQLNIDFEFHFYSQLYRQMVATAAAGAMGGALAKTTVAPLERTKIYFQTHLNNKFYPGSLGAPPRAPREPPESLPRASLQLPRASRAPPWSSREPPECLLRASQSLASAF